jgi:hypothetical protein
MDDYWGDDGDADESMEASIMSGLKTAGAASQFGGEAFAAAARLKRQAERGIQNKVSSLAGSAFTAVKHGIESASRWEIAEGPGSERDNEARANRVITVDNSGTAYESMVGQKLMEAGAASASEPVTRQQLDSSRTGIVQGEQASDVSARDHDTIDDTNSTTIDKLQSMKAEVAATQVQPPQLYRLQDFKEVDIQGSDYAKETVKNFMRASGHESAWFGGLLPTEDMEKFLVLRNVGPTLAKKVSSSFAEGFGVRARNPQSWLWNSGPGHDLYMVPVQAFAGAADYLREQQINGYVPDEIGLRAAMSGSLTDSGLLGRTWLKSGTRLSYQGTEYVVYDRMSGYAEPEPVFYN